jgi:hypothetical protein
MESNIPGNGPDPHQIPGNLDQPIFEYPRRGCNYLGQIPLDM